MRFASAFVVAVTTLAVAGLVYAQSGTTAVKANGSAISKKDIKGKLAIQVTPESEAAALTFVQRNHAELAELLTALKTSQPQEYERAIKDIFRVTQRLAAIQERDPLQYELEVAAWTAQSRVQLLAAKLRMGSSDELTKQLRAALQVQNAAKIALLKHERQRAADRLEKIESDITRLEASRDDVVDKQLKLLTRAAAEGRPAKGGG